MKHLRRFLAACALACAVTVSAYADQIECGRMSEQPEGFGIVRQW